MRLNQKPMWIQTSVRPLAFLGLLLIMVGFGWPAASGETSGSKDLKHLGAQRPPHASIGQPAPKVTLKPLKGEAFDLADLKGEVVLLDFWATWCGPCVMSLPKVTKVAGAYADKGLTFYAVNLRETEKKVTAFMKEKNITPPVAMDRSGKIGQAFGVRGIPHSALIDKKGVIRYVHVGFMPGMEKQIKKEIETLLAE